MASQRSAPFASLRRRRQSLTNALARALPFCLLIGFGTVCARASMWIDPDWQQMLKESELIALVQVTEGGEFLAKVETLRSFKGQAPSTFYVVDFNNFNWPADAIALESFKKNQRYYLFLKREQALPYLEFLADTSSIILRYLPYWLPPEFRRLFYQRKFLGPLEAAKHGRLWNVWTPTAGDLPVEGEKVRYRLLRPTQALGAPPRDGRQFERFLVAALSYHTAGKADAALLGETLQVIRAEATKSTSAATAEESGEASELAHQLGIYFLAGGREFDVAFAQIATADDPNARFMLARLLGEIGEERARKLLLAMLGDAHAIVQGEVVRGVAKGMPEEVGPVLHEHLVKAAAGGIGPTSIMDPIRNQLDGGRTEIIRALGELRYKAAAPDIIRLLDRVEDVQSLRVSLEALRKMENREYAQALWKPLRNPPLLRTIAEWVRENRVTELKDALLSVVEDPPENAGGGPHWAAIEALGAIGDEETGARLTAMLQQLTTRPAPEFFDDGLTASIVGALAKLQYRPASGTIEQAFFYWFGVDSAFAGSPELLKLKRRLEREIAAEAGAQFRDFRSVEPRAIVFLLNREELARSDRSQPEYRCAVHVDVRSGERPEIDAEALKARLTEFAAKHHAPVSVTRWNRNFGKGSEGGDLRAHREPNSSFFYRYAQYVQATREPTHLRLVEFLLASGLAQEWGAEDLLRTALTTEPLM